MTDSMDGRVVDPGAVEAQAVELPFLRDFFAKQGTNFVRSYSNSPQCVPSRSSMCTGRRTDQIEAWSNEKGLAASEDGTLDKACIYFYGAEQCAAWAKVQNHSETIFSGLERLGADSLGWFFIGAAGGAPKCCVLELVFLPSPFDGVVYGNTGVLAKVHSAH